MKNSLSKEDFYRDFKREVNRNIQECVASINVHLKDKSILIERLNDRIAKYSNDDLLCLRSPLGEIHSVSKRFKSSDTYIKILSINTKMLYDISIKSKYESFKVDYDTYIKFSDEYNSNGVKLLSKGLTLNIGGDCGNVTVHRVQRKATTARKVNYIASNKYKKLLISEGRIPYNKDDAAKCLEAGIEYKGEDWRIYHFDDYYYYLNWRIYIPDYGEYYSFLPSRSYNLKIPREEIIKGLTKPEDVFKQSLGLIKYIYLLDEAYPDYHTNFTSLSKL